MDQSWLPNKVVKSEPPKRLANWFISNETTLESSNIWCFDQNTASELLIQLQYQSEITTVSKIKF